MKVFKKQNSIYIFYAIIGIKTLCVTGYVHGLCYHVRHRDGSYRAIYWTCFCKN